MAAWEQGVIDALLGWYDKEKRAFSFRGNKDPYRVWVSEIMLQQTRTETVEKYFDRFTAAFPTVEALAAAPLEQVLKLWEGLGYYSRARNLHRCAHLVAGRGFPDNAAELQKLPGIGPYTAAAVASIAFDEPVPAMDGNLTRVLSRLYLIEENAARPEVKRALYRLGAGLMPSPRAGDMNQALMDLGARVCVPGTPDCSSCPVEFFCRARAEGAPETLPNLDAKKPPRVVPMGVALIRAGSRMLMRRRDEKLLGGLYVFFLSENDDGAEDLTRAVRKILPAARLSRPLGRARHVFTHRVWEMNLYLFDTPPVPAPPGWLWASGEDIRSLPLPTAMKAAKAAALDSLGEGDDVSKN